MDLVSFAVTPDKQGEFCKMVAFRDGGFGDIRINRGLSGDIKLLPVLTMFLHS